uniref:Uncharacterized protein n=1 Tax=Acrobeloides nanus TaxID=290746 RepID=A0A914BVH8_9BILA
MSTEGTIRGTKSCNGKPSKNQEIHIELMPLYRALAFHSDPTKYWDNANDAFQSDPLKFTTNRHIAITTENESGEFWKMPHTAKFEDIWRLNKSEPGLIDYFIDGKYAVNSTRKDKYCLFKVKIEAKYKFMAKMKKDPLTFSLYDKENYRTTAGPCFSYGFNRCHRELWAPFDGDVNVCRNIAETNQDMDDKGSSLVNADCGSCVILYADKNCKGRSVRFTKETQYKDENHANFAKINFDNMASSYMFC